MKEIEQKNIKSDASYLFALIYKHKVFITVVTLVAAIVSVIVSLLLPVWYASTVNCVPPQESGSNFSSGLSGLSSVMKDFGLSRIGGKSTQEYTMFVFLESRTVIDSVIKKYDLAKVYDIPDSLMTEVRKEFLDNRSIEYTDEGNFEITIWDTDRKRAADIANDYIKITNHVANKTYKEELEVNLNYINNRISSIDSMITVISGELAEISKDNLMFSPEEQAQSASKVLAELKSYAFQYEIFYDFYKKNYGEDDPTTQLAKEMFDAANSKIDDAFNKPGLVGNFSLQETTPIAVDYLTKYADIEALTKTKALLVTTLEKTIIDSRKHISNFFVIDKAIPADKKDKPKRAFIVAGSTIGAFVLAVFILLLVNSFKLAKKNMKEIDTKN